METNPKLPGTLPRAAGGSGRSAILGGTTMAGNCDADGDPVTHFQYDAADRVVLQCNGSAAVQPCIATYRSPAIQQPEWPAEKAFYYDLRIRTAPPQPGANPESGGLLITRTAHDRDRKLISQETVALMAEQVQAGDWPWPRE